MRFVVKMSWSVIRFVIPRSKLREFTQRSEAGRPALTVYYPLGRRLEQHQRWTAPRLRAFEQPPTFPSVKRSNLFFLRGPEAEGRDCESPNGFTASSPNALMRMWEQLIRQGSCSPAAAAYSEVVEPSRP